MIVAAGPAGPDDEARLDQLRVDAEREVRGQRGGPRLLRSDPPMGESAVFVGTIDSVVVGYARAVAAGEIGTVAELYVEPDARGVGVGEVVFQACARWLAGRGCHTVDAFALPGSREAKQFLEARGLVARLITMSRALPVDSDN
ncbi:MAG TPA: GNAT family N-acetyltransferase [Acidimicrobiales bacterium]|nr:GNAT family N-acetyltransferase [Acidimicrobiales bacterium]